MEVVRGEKTAETNHLEGDRAFFDKDPIHGSSVQMLLLDAPEGCRWAQFEAGDVEKTFMSGTFINESLEDVMTRLACKNPGGFREHPSFTDHAVLTQEQIACFLSGQKTCPRREFEEVTLPRRPVTEKPRKY